MINVEREQRESPLFREPHSSHYTRLSRAERSVFCFFSLSLFSSLPSPKVSVSRQCAGPPRSYGSDCSRETGGAARSTNRAPAFAKRHLAPTRAQRCCRAERRRTSAETPDRRSSPRFHPPTPYATAAATTPPPSPQRRWIDVRFAASLLRRCPNFRYGGFMAGLSAKRANSLVHRELCLGSDSSVSPAGVLSFELLPRITTVSRKGELSDKSLLSFHSCVT